MVREGTLRHRPGPRPHRQARRHRPGARPAGTTTGSATTASPPPSAAPAPPRPATPRSPGCASAWSAAPTSRPAGSASTATSPTATTCTRCCTWATTSTSTAPASTATASPTRTSAATTRPARWSASSDYRRRHAQYKTDPDLQRLHAKYPFVITWDDHEVTNDQWKAGAENHDASEGDYRARRARAHRAYDEWMPVRMNGTADLRDGTRLFRRLQFGSLAELSMLDLRTYRDQQVASPAPLPVARTPRDQQPGPHHRRPRAARLAQGRPAHRRAAVEAGRQPGDDRAGHLRPAAQGRAEPDQRRHRSAARRRRGVQHRPVGRLHRRPPRGVRAHPRPRRPRRRLPHRRHPLRLGLRAAVRRVHLPGGRRQRRRGAGVQLGHLQQPQGHHRHPRRGPRASPSRPPSRPTTGT